MYDGDLVLDWGGSTSIADFLKATTVGVGIIKSYRVNCQLNITEFLHHDGGYFVSACVYRKVYLLVGPLSTEFPVDRMAFGQP